MTPSWMVASSSGVTWWGHDGANATSRPSVRRATITWPSSVRTRRIWVPAPSPAGSSSLLRALNSLMPEPNR